MSPSGELGKIDVGQVSNFRIVQNGINAIDMPDFYMGYTETAAPSTTSLIHTSAMSAGMIYIPQGVHTLRFGGVNPDFTPAGGTPLNQQALNAEFQINLGLPLTLGTSVIVNTVTSDAHSTTSSGTTTVNQDYATFLVTGRLNLFQANAIDGNTTSGVIPTQFAAPGSATSQSVGGTFLISQGGAATGQIGDVRIGGNATNFTTFVTEDPINATAAEGQLDAKISNFYIGGETNNVLLVAPSGARNISFGLGMDNVTISTNAISSLRANRDVSNSTVTVSRSIGNLLIGGDVTNTNVNVGESQSLFGIANTPATVLGQAGTGVFFGEPVPTVAAQRTNAATGQLEPFAQNGGTIKVRIAGNVTNSVFSASVDPNPPGSTSTLFGPDGDSIFLPRGVINAKVEGTTDNSSNSLVDTSLVSPKTAFFARVVHLNHGPIIPPTVPYQPTAAPTIYHRGQDSLKGLIKIDHYPSVDGRKLTKTDPPIKKRK